MLIQQDNNSSIASYHAPLQTLASADEVVDTRQPALALQVGSALDPGIERRQKPNEDTLFVTHGVIPSASTSLKPFALFMYRFLGEKATVEVDASTVSLAAGDILLLCSDGLWEMVRDRQIAAILATPMQDPSRGAHALVQAALARGGVDNVSVIVVQVSSHVTVCAPGQRPSIHSGESR